LAAAAGGRAAARDGRVAVGIVNTLFRDIPKKTVDATAEPFRKLMEKEAGRKGDFQMIPDAYQLARQLSKGGLDLGVFQGYEFAWVRQQHPELRPLAIAVNQQRNPRAFLVVRNDSGLSGFTSLKGKSLAIPARPKGYALLFLDKLLHQEGQTRQGFFSKVTTPANTEDALDDVVDREVKAALVDGVGLERYKARKPGRAAALKVLVKSEAFPAPVVAYRDGALDKASRQAFLNALLRAPDTADGRQVLTLWKLTGFERVPRDYDEELKDIVKAYPPPRDHRK
jgi:ABC-type phosphate/phosphonate transport system substrate-binding protein